MRRLFLAFDLPDDLRSQLAVAQFLLPLPRRVEPAMFHLTLVFLGKVADPDLEALHEALSTLRLSPVEIRLHGLGHFGGERPRSVHVLADRKPALLALQAKLETTVRRVGLQVEARRFIPHVTLGNFQPPPLPDALRLERALAEGAGFTAPAYTATELVLYESHLSGKAPWYEPLVRYPLIA